jgi:hypothetical protein
VVAWGYNEYGETDVPVAAQSAATAIAAGDFHTTAAPRAKITKDNNIANDLFCFITLSSGFCAHLGTAVSVMVFHCIRLGVVKDCLSFDRRHYVLNHICSSATAFTA